MPANLPPEYYEAEKKLKQASNSRERVIALEELISTVPKHKGTDKLRADLRKRLSQLREEAVKKKRSGKGDLYTVERQGASQVCLAGFANSGKSSILKALTNAHPVIAGYPVSTVMPLAGMMPYEDIQFQLVDLPPIGNESTDGWVSGILRTADLLVLVVDLQEDPDIQTELLIGQLSAWKIPLGEKGAVNGMSKPAVIAANKTDLPSAGVELERLSSRYGTICQLVGVSTKNMAGLEELRRVIFDAARIIRVYSKEPGKEPDMKRPFVLNQGAKVLDLAELIHRDFVVSLKYARIWGSAKFESQRVQRDYILHDKDIVEFHLR